MSESADAFAKHLQAHRTGACCEFMAGCIWCRVDRYNDDCDTRREHLDYVRSR